jgi:hypothetical protein
MLKELIKLFIRTNGRNPNKLELLQLKFKAAQQSGKGEVIEFPPSAITDWRKPRPTTGKKGEVIDTSFASGVDRSGKRITMSNADYGSLKDEWFGRIIANTEDDINTFLKRGIDAADERFKNLTPKQRKDFLDMVDYRLKHGNEKFIDNFTDAKGEFKLPEDLAGGGLAGMLGEPTYADENHRVPFKDGKGPKMSRRGFLKTAAGLASIPFFGKFFKFAKPAAKVADLTSVSIQNADGMPVWFKPLVNRVIKEGTDITKLPPNKGGAWKEREIVHSAKLGENQGVKVSQDLDNQTITVEYQSADNMGGIDDAVRLEYKAAEEIPMDNEVFKNLPKGKSSVKTKPTFSAEEAWPHGTTGDYKDITMEGTNTVGKVDDLYSDTSALKQFGTNKTLSKKELEIAKQKRKRVNEINNDLGEQNQLLPDPPDYDDFASGGRVPFSKGKRVLEGLAKLMDEFFPETTKIGKTSKPLAEKTQLRRSLADFQEREKNRKIRETINADEKAVAKLRKEHKEKYGEHIYDHRRSDEINKQSEAFWKKINDLQYKIDENRYLVDDVVIDGKKYKLSDKDRPPTEEELDDKYLELWNDEQSPWDFGSTVRELDAELANRAEEYKYMYQQYKMGKLDPEAGSVSRARLNLLRKRAEEAEDTKDFRLFGEDEADELEYLENHFKQVDKEESFQFAERMREAKEKARVNKKSPWYTDDWNKTPEEELRREFPGISDDLIRNILADDNPQRIAEVKASLHEALKMQQKGMGPDEIINIFKKKPTKHADGGRVPMWLGGGLGKGKNLLREIMRHHEKTGTTGLKGSEMLKLVNPKQFNKMLDSPEGIPAIAKEMIEKYTKEMKADRVGAVEHSLGLAKKMKTAKDKSKEMDKITEALTKDFVDKGMDKEMVEGLIEMFLKARYPDYQKVKTIKALPNVTDEAILELENIQKNLATKDRKLNASGGLAGMLGE